jgi:hypothetical protein
MGINRDNNPIVVSGSTTITGSVIFSTPCVVNQIIWTSVEASASIHLVDKNERAIFDSVAEPNVPMRIIEDATVFANGLCFASTKAGASTDTCMEAGKLYVWLR